MTDGKIHWHESFSAVLRIELEEELDYIEILDEYLLGKEPMRVDVIVIKKQTDKKIQKNIGRIFLKHNLIEYKSPEDYLSVNDFYKLYGYACFYQSDTEKIGEINPEEITLTFVSNHYPRKMIQHLEKVHKMSVKKVGSGIYYLYGDIFPIQLLVTKKLSKEENFWLNHLRNDLKAGGEIKEIVTEYEKNKNSKWYQAAMNVITRANWKEMEGEKEMCEALRELFADELEESCKSGELLKLISIVCKMLIRGKGVEEIAEDLEETKEAIQEICDVAEKYAPEYDIKKILEEIQSKKTK